ncbi:TetR/AcrR family transcriptional regulator [Sphingorhabdus sp.]|uniref:TetR/AcrR family transcriptional regulator n=1 Tax=Sphingorhabdus sp. TaxID=1902408 RepID=UPI0037C50B26
MAEFLAEGLNGANIESIARKACVGKSTIYRKYLSKQGLLLAVAQRRMKELEERWQEFPFDIKDPENTLYRIALMSYREWSGKSLPIYRIIYTEAERMPEIARAVDAMSKQSAIRPVLDYFQQLQEHKVIAVRNVAEAASLFLVVSAGAMRSFLIPIELDEEARSQLARDAVQFFLYGYAKRNKKS